MVKFLKTIALILFGITMFILISFVGIKYLFPSAAVVKNALSESNIYSLVAAGIRTNLIDQAQPGAEKDALLEFSNDAINTNTIKQFTDRTTDQFYELIQKPSKVPILILPFSIFGDKITASLEAKNIQSNDPEIKNFLTDRSINLQNNLLYQIAVNLGKIILVLSVILIALIALLVLPQAWPQKLKWAGGAFLFSGILILVQAVFFWIGLSQKIQDNIIRSSNLKDDKYLLAAQKILNTILQNQKIFYSVVAVALIGVGIGLIIWGRVLGKKNTLKLNVVK